jgi:small subunit ribosomal protein S8
MTDPIADMFTRIRNASAVGKKEILLPMSKIKHAIAKVLVREKWLANLEVIPGGLKTKRAGFDQLKIVLKYQKNGRSYINSIKRISKPGVKIYVNKEEIPVVLNGHGMVIISTSAGIMTGREAKKQGIGGELIGEIY